VLVLSTEDSPVKLPLVALKLSVKRLVLVLLVMTPFVARRLVAVALSKNAFVA
jgi:hypothetical protein